jgi:DNA-binding GntR family transcriptional regulator
MVQAPLHRKVFSAIQEKIFSGTWPEGTAMPTELELCAIFNVSRITVRRAFDELTRLGLVERIRGRGTFVRRTRLRSGDANEGFLGAMRDRGAMVTTRLLFAGLEAADPGIAATLRLKAEPDGRPLAWRFRRLRSVDGSPMAIMNTFVPRQVGDAMRGFDLEHESFYELYGRILGTPIARTEGVVSAISPDQESCELLGVPSGSAQLWYKSVGYLADGTPVETCFSIFNASKYEFAVSNLRFSESPAER